MSLIELRLKFVQEIKVIILFGINKEDFESASNFGTICKMRPYTSCKEKIHSLLFAPNPKTKQLTYGNVMYNVNVQTRGLIIDSDLPYLAASPGIIIY